MMRALGGMVVVVILLVRTHCEVRARDPGEEGETGGDAGGTGVGGEGTEGAGGWEQKDLLNGPETTQPPGPESQRPPESLPARTGNWCAYVQQRVVTSVVKCGTEKYTIRSPCPPETPNCQLVMFQASSRPVYRQQQQMFTALQWRCCPGHGGLYCQDSDEQNDTQSPEPQLHHGNHDPGNPQLHHGNHDPGNPQLHHGNLDPGNPQLHHDNHDPGNPQLHHGNHDPGNPQLHHGNHDPGNPQLHHGNHDPGNPQLHHGNHDPGNPQLHHGNHDPGNPQLHHGNHHQTNGAQGSDLHSDLLVPVVAALVMAQLNPVLEGFNRSLLLLDGRVGALARDLAQWRPGAAREHSESRLEEVLEEVQEVRLLLDSQRTALEERLHSQHAMLHYNLTSFKTEVDVKLKRTGKMMQTSIQGMNASLVDLQAHQEQMGGAGARSQGPSSSPLHPSPAQETTWTNHLNTKLSALEEDLKENARSVGDLRETLLELEERIAQTGRDSQVQFMETGLDVEEAREVVLGRVREMERNISLVVQQTQALDTDVDFLFTLVYNCTTLRDEVAHLERGVANLTELANEKRLAPEEGGQWAPLVKELQLSLQQVKDSLAAEQGAGLQEEMRRLSGSFNALLKDAVRHSDVLEILLGEDVLEFLRWTPPQQEAHSIPALKEQMRSLQEKMMGHNHSLSTLQRDRAESSMADQPLSAEGEVRRRSHAPRREQQLLMATDPADGGGGALEKVVEELEVRVQALEEHGGGAQEEQLQEEVLWLRRAVEDHLRVFKKVFSQAETLEDSHRTLDLQDLWTLTQDSRRERRRGGERRRGDKDGERRRGDKDGEVRREALRSRRDITASPPQPQSSPLLLATWMIGLRGEGRFLVFRASLNVGGVYSETSGRFTAPQTGLYLLLLTLDLRPGHTHLLLRRWSGKELCLLQKEVMEDTGALSFLRLLHLEEKEELSVELRAGGLLESSSNVLAVMLLH